MDRAMAPSGPRCATWAWRMIRLIWFCSDNGATEIGNNGGLRASKNGLWKGGLRVPALMEMAG